MKKRIAAAFLAAVFIVPKILHAVKGTDFSPDTSDTTLIIFIALGVIAIALIIFIRRRR